MASEGVRGILGADDEAAERAESLGGRGAEEVEARQGRLEPGGEPGVAVDQA
jgi:hypothetical protein